MKAILSASALGISTACARTPVPHLGSRMTVVNRPALSAVATLSLADLAAEDDPCRHCASNPLGEIAAAIEARVADLKARGGECEEYGSLLESALASGRITLRPYMWRVDGNLASAQGESSGEMTIARDIDSLNVGVRKVEDILKSAEHEAVHIALRIPSGDPAREARVDERVRSCRADR
jgi:hypothetical protein